MSAAIPLADTPALRPRARITRALAAALGAAALACAVIFLFGSTNPRTRTLVPLPSHANTVLVLDLSASISSDSFSRIGGTLQALARSNRRFALVVFSGVAYEALPPGTPAADLAPLVRYFTLPPQRIPGFMPSFPPNPWASTFTGGTNISAGMQLAYDIAVAAHPRSAVVLVSDLDDSPGDVAALAGVLTADREARVPVRIVGLNPAPSDVSFFRTALGPSAPIVEAPLVNAAPPQNVTPFPWLLVALALAAALVLGVRAAWLPRLDWSASAHRPGEAQ